MSTIDLNQLVTWRRELHRFPEIGWTEFMTTARLITELRGMGLDVIAGPKVINREFVRGRKADVVERGLALARERGADEALLAEMDGLTGCMAVFDSGKPGPTVALRFDIDCVAVQ